MTTSQDIARHLAKVEAHLTNALAGMGLIKKALVKPRGRPRRHTDDMHIYLRVDSNPYPYENGKCHKVFNMIEHGMTVGAFRERVIVSGLGPDGWGYLRDNVRKKYIEVR